MRVLAGDIGGTKIWLRLADVAAGGWRIAAEARFASARYDGLGPVLREFLANAGASAPPAAACFGIAGPIGITDEGEIARVTNLPWVIESARIAEELGGARVRLVNDFQAIGYAIETLASGDLATLQPGVRRARAPCAVIGAGTGLGQTLLVWQGDHYDAVATEGGHVDFAPTDDLQIDLLRALARQYGRVSCERILSGAGLVDVYAFLLGRGVPRGAEALLEAPDAAAAVSAAALAQSDPAAAAALRLFVTVYGAHAGNVALGYLAAGGVYIAGGIAPKILPALRAGDFIRAFQDKGRMAPLLERIPVHVIINEKAGLLGATLEAARLGGRQ